VCHDTLPRQREIISRNRADDSTTTSEDAEYQFVEEKVLLPRTSETKATIALALKCARMSADDIALACDRFPWTGSKGELVAALKDGGYATDEAENIADRCLSSVHGAK
jgi:hypothetical protein